MLPHPAAASSGVYQLIKLDWEHTEFMWIRKEELKNFDIVPELDKSLEKALE